MRVRFQLVQTLHFAFEVFLFACLFAWSCVSIPDYVVTRTYSDYALTGYCLQFEQVCLCHTCLLWSPGTIGQLQQPHWLVLRRSRNEPFSSSHMVLALQAGVVSQELLDALTAVDNKLSSACLFAEYWDTHSERDAWFQQHLSSQLHSLAVPLHQWCCDHSASWARGAMHIPVYSSPPSCQPAAPSSITTTSVTGSKRRYAAITFNGRHRPQPSSSLPPDGPLSKAAREKEEYQQVLKITINLVASLGQVPGLLQELSSSTLGPPSKLLASAKSSLQPRHQPVPFEHTICRSRDSWCGALKGNCLRPSVSSKPPILTLPIFYGKVGIPWLFGAKIHCIEFGLVGQILGCAYLIFSQSKCDHGRDQIFS